MATIYDCSDNSDLLTGMRLARTAISRGRLVVMPTDTVYGIAADAFQSEAVQRLLDAKGRTRQAPPPVLIPNVPTLDALAQEVPPTVRLLVERFWPGGLTIILPAQESLAWDLGETGGTVALRMPSNPVALQLLSETGPLAVSSANLSGQPAAMTAAGAEGMLGDSVSVYLDDGDAGADYPGADPGAGSTIVDATGLLHKDGTLTIVREGVIPAAAVWAVVEEAKRAAEDAEPAKTAEAAKTADATDDAATSTDDAVTSTGDGATSTGDGATSTAGGATSTVDESGSLVFGTDEPPTSETPRPDRGRFRPPSGEAPA